jgi:hypothetical protein
MNPIPLQPPQTKPPSPPICVEIATVVQWIWQHLHWCSANCSPLRHPRSGCHGSQKSHRCTSRTPGCCWRGQRLGYGEVDVHQGLRIGKSPRTHQGHAKSALDVASRAGSSSRTPRRVFSSCRSSALAASHGLLLVSPATALGHPGSCSRIHSRGCQRRPLARACELLALASGRFPNRGIRTRTFVQQLSVPALCVR